MMGDAWWGCTSEPSFMHARVNSGYMPLTFHFLIALFLFHIGGVNWTPGDVRGTHHALPPGSGVTIRRMKPLLDETSFPHPQSFPSLRLRPVSRNHQTTAHRIFPAPTLAHRNTAPPPPTFIHLGMFTVSSSCLFVSAAVISYYILSPST